MLKLAHGLSFADLYRREGLLRVDAAFLDELKHSDAALHAHLLAARTAVAGSADALAAKQESELLIALAPHLDDFIACLFGIEKELQQLSERHHELAPLYSCKRVFVQRKALHKYKPEEAAIFDGAALRAQLAPFIDKNAGGDFSELAFAKAVNGWLQDEAGGGDRHTRELDLALRYAAWAVATPAGRARHDAGVLFKTPHKLDYQHLVPHLMVHEAAGYTEYRMDAKHLRRRDGFALTDAGTDLTGALDQANYCIWCHEQGKDSCSKGLKEK